MAKISAHGSIKLAERTFTVTRTEAGETYSYKYFWVLRSDGTVLVASSNASAKDSYGRRRSNYRVAGKFSKINDQAGLRNSFDRHVDRVVSRYKADASVQVAA